MKYFTLLVSALLVAFVISVPVFAKESSAGMAVPGSDDVVEMQVMDESDDALEDAMDDMTEDVSMGEVHRSKVAEAVQELVKAADRTGGIGAQIRMLAKEQEDIHTDVAKKMEAVEGKSWVARFLFGSDFDTLGELRSALVTSENGIDVLKKARDKVSPSVKADIETQIEVLEDENEHARAFIDEQEGKFSLFGWLVKLF